MTTDTTAADLRVASERLRPIGHRTTQLPPDTADVLADALETLAGDHEKAARCDAPGGCNNCNTPQWALVLFADFARRILDDGGAE